jgi:hypothetical protein
MPSRSASRPGRNISSEQYIVIEIGLADGLDLRVISFRSHSRHADNFPLQSDRFFRGGSDAAIIILQAADLAPELLALIDRGEKLGVEIFSILLLSHRRPRCGI